MRQPTWNGVLAMPATREEAAALLAQYTEPQIAAWPEMLYIRRKFTL